MTPQDRYRALGGSTRSRLLTVLERAARPLGVRDLSSALDLHPNSVREQLRVLVDAGLVSCEVSAPSGRGRPRLLYAPRPVPDAEQPYRVLARVLAEQLERSPDPSAIAIEAGERWGAAMAGPIGAPLDAGEARDRLVRLLDGAGFAPEARGETSDPIRLGRCPFEPLARDHRTVVCGVHLGLMRGVLREYGAPIDAVELHPHAEADVCLAHVATGNDH